MSYKTLLIKQMFQIAEFYLLRKALILIGYPIKLKLN